MVRRKLSDAMKTARRKYGARAAHELILLGMRIEGWLSLLPGANHGVRAISTACWHFPIYSQTFVYREVSELARKGVRVRFSYSELAGRSELPEEFRSLWRLKRKLILTEATSTRDLEHYMRRMPQRVNEVARLIGEASGMTAEEVIAHEHFRHAMSFTRMAECWRATYIHTYFFYERTLFAMVATHLLGIPRGISCYADHMLDDYRLKLVAAHMRSCDVVVATSNRIKRELETLTRCPLPNVVVKPNAIDVRQFPAAERPVRDLTTGCKIVTVSRIHPKKGLTHLVDAAMRLHERGIPATLHILGDADAHDAESLVYHQALKQRLAAASLDRVVRLEGRKTSPEVRQFLMEADIFAAPFVELPNGDKDGIPTALLEAMATGCAIVTTDAGSILEAVDHDVEGIIVPQRDDLALANAIEALIRDPNLRARLSRAAIDRVRREFDIEKCEARFHQRVRAAHKREDRQ